VEEPPSLGIIENIRTEGTLDYTINLCELTNAFEGELLHSRKVSTPICLQNLLSFLHLLERKTHSKKSLNNYNQSHVVTSDEYLQFL
jgi:hypothetical protein